MFLECLSLLNFKRNINTDTTIDILRLDVGYTRARITSKLTFFKVIRRTFCFNRIVGCPIAIVFWSSRHKCCNAISLFQLIRQIAQVITCRWFRLTMSQYENENASNLYNEHMKLKDNFENDMIYKSHHISGR